VKHQYFGVYRQIRDLISTGDGVYRQVCDLISNPSKQFYVFANEQHLEIFIERKGSELAKEWNDKSIRTAVKFYNQHLAQDLKTANSPKVILLTNDGE